MSGISNLNIVIQQGDKVRDVQQMKSAHQDTSQIAASVKPDKEVKERTVVQETPDSKKLRWQKEREKRALKRAEEKKKKKKNKDNNNNSDHILDTIA